VSRARALLAFHAVRSEGGLLPYDLLQRIALEDKTVPGLSPETYHLEPGDRFRDATNRAWTRLVTAWRAFRAAVAKHPETDPATTVTREKWLLPLFDVLGYGRLAKASAFTIEGKSYAISHGYQHSPIHLLGCRVGLDTKQKGVAGASAASPHGLVQDFLNRSDDHLWGFVSNGHVLRVLRDHHSLTQQAYVEFDLEAIFEGEAFSEFVLLYLVCHQSRVEADKPEESWLERWFTTSRDEGVRALDQLRKGVESAIAALGTGFLRHKANKALHGALETGALDKQDYYRQLLRLVYRLIFLFVAEDRGALLDPKAPEAARARYERFYATKRLRDLADRRRGGPHGDLWQQIRLIMGKLWDGSPELGLPALGSFLWRPSSTGDLNGLELANEDLLSALRALCYVEHGRAKYAVSWRNIGAEELGSVYESLLELHPDIHKEAARLELSTAAGHERKTTGSYYTPTSLVDCLLDSALDPVLDEAAKKADPEKAILELKVCDPACGSGHFLVAAARRIAVRLASVRAGGDEPSPPEVQRALRDVVGRCIYGVDLNPMAVELCKVSLWMEAIEPGKPLSFLDAHVQQGNALLGATPALMTKGIPDEAFEAIEGDDKEVAKRLKKRNKKARETGQLGMEGLFAQSPPGSYYGRISTAAGKVEEDRDDDIAAVRKKEEDWAQVTGSVDYLRGKALADAWCAAFVWPKQKGALEEGAVTEDLWRRMEKDFDRAAPEVTKAEVRRLAHEYGFFHWHLAFPHVLRPKNGSFATDDPCGWDGGFDLVLGNPPWEQTELKEKEWFAERAPNITTAATGAARKKLIADLARKEPNLHADFVAAKRRHDAVAFVAGSTGRYPLCGRGRINTYAVFAELNRSVVSLTGRVGCIVPSGIATDDTTKYFFQSLVDDASLVSLYDFQSGPGLFGEIGHARFKFCLLTIAGAARPHRGAEFAFSLRDVGSLSEAERKFTLSPEDIALLNPNTRTCPIFRSARDARLTKAVYARVPVLIQESTPSLPERNPWGLKIRRVFNMGIPEVVDGCVTRDADSEHFVPMYESKMFHQFEHRFGDHADKPIDSQGTALPEVSCERLESASYCTTPRFWISRSKVEEKLSTLWGRPWLLSWRDICRAEDVRTSIACVLPLVGTDFTVRIGLVGEVARIHALLATLNSLVFDYCARQMVGGTHLSDYVMHQLPVYPPHSFEDPAPWAVSTTLFKYIVPRALELTYTAWDLEPFAKDCGYDGPPLPLGRGPPLPPPVRAGRRLLPSLRHRAR